MSLKRELPLLPYLKAVSLKSDLPILPYLMAVP